jgi:hypothetical protein
VRGIVIPLPVHFLPLFFRVSPRVAIRNAMKRIRIETPEAAPKSGNPSNPNDLSSFTIDIAIVLR